MNVSESSLDSVVRNGQTFMVDPKEMKDRGMDIVNLCRLIAVERFESPLIRFAVGSASFDSATTKPVRKNKRIVISARSTL